MLFQMAARNLWRAKRRTLITLFTVAFGVWLAVTFTGTGDYTYTNMLDTGARMGFGHVTVEAAGYADAPGVDRPLVGAVAVADALEARADVAKAIPRVVGQAMFASATKSVGRRTPSSPRSPRGRRSRTSTAAASWSARSWPTSSGCA